MRKKATILFIVFLAITTFYGCKKDNNTASLPDYKNLIIGKWLWYKTITTGSQANQFDTFYNQGMFKEFLANGKVIYTGTNGQSTTENYFFLDNKLGQTFSNGKDTFYSQILTCTAGSFSIYDKTTYSNVNPPVVVEYWHYFVK